MSELQQNVLAHLKRTLTDLSDVERQLRYKQAVPFVHVPLELAAQMSGYARLGQEAGWFQDFFSEQDVEAIDMLSQEIHALVIQCGRALPDVPEISHCAVWVRIVAMAEDVLGQLAMRLP